MKNKKFLFLSFLLYLCLCASAQINPVIKGVWGATKGENAYFEITTDSVYYVDDLKSFKYTGTADSIFIRLDGFIYKAKYGVSNDSLKLYGKSKVRKFVRFTENGSFTMLPGYNYLTSNITNYGSYVLFYLVFYPTSYMAVSTSYRVATVSENCRPLVARILSFTTGGRTWSITMNPNGDVYASIVSGSGISGSPYPTNNVVSLGTLMYNF